MSDEQQATKRVFTHEQKVAILAEVDALAGQRGAASQVARAHSIDPSLISTWRKKLEQGDAAAPKAAKPTPKPKAAAPAVPAAPGDDPVLAACWAHALKIPDLRTRFEFVAEAGTRLL